MLIKINGKALKLEYDFNSVCEIEDSLGKSINEIVANKQSFGFKAIRAFFWGGLIKNNPSMDIQEAGDIISQHIKNNPAGLEYIIDKTFLCMKQDGVISDIDQPEDDGNFEDQETKKK